MQLLQQNNNELINNFNKLFTLIGNLEIDKKITILSLKH